MIISFGTAGFMCLSRRFVISFGLVIVLLGPYVVKLSVTATSSHSDLPLLLSVRLVMETFGDGIGYVPGYQAS